MQVFEFYSYRAFLAKKFSSKGLQRGSRGKLASYLDCQPSFLTRVITEKAHLSLEHALKASEYLALGEEERDFFMLLVLKEKAGSKNLEKYYDTKIEAILKLRESIHKRIKVETNISLKDQVRYYGVWYISAIHVLTALPGFSTVEQIAERLRLEEAKVREALRFLLEVGFVEQENGQYSMSSRRIHLTKESLMLPRHHSNWRLKVLDSLELEKKHDLHYSSVLGIAKEDIKLFKERILRLIEEFEPLIEKSKEEVPVIFLCDLFEL